MNKPTIFLVDDDYDDQELFAIALKRTNVEVNCVFADDGTAAIQKLQQSDQFSADIIFLDMNMPKMNGLQCLEKLRSIDKLKDTPVFLYSTFADARMIERNRIAGATDTIIKPSNLKDLTSILSELLKKHLILIVLSFFLLFNKDAKAQVDSFPTVKQLKALDIEDLVNVMVTSVSKTPERLSETASAVQVISEEDIRRSNAVRLPDALRLAPNLQVAQSGSHEWAISARGFNGAPVTGTSLANKLLVLIDGRTVYSPLFGGVFWDAQNVMLRDVEQIEVISGPGGSIWGANAVNGIINISSKSSDRTQGVYASGLKGDFYNNVETFRYGFRLDSTAFCRVYGQHMDMKQTFLTNGNGARDNWFLTQGGFRSDFFRTRNTITLQGDIYGGSLGDTASTLINGQNILGRITHRFSNESQLTAQTYFDHTWRNVRLTRGSDETFTYDLDIQHSLPLGNINTIIWGGGYRLVYNELLTESKQYNPPKVYLHLLNVFVQNQIRVIPNKLELTLGSKVLYNDYSKYEFQPTIRLAYFPSFTQTYWAAASNSVRTPTRLDADFDQNDLGSPPNFRSEKVTTFEFGYRITTPRNLAISISTYYNLYNDLRSIDTNKVSTRPIFYFRNNANASTYGAELALKYRYNQYWTMKAGYSFINESFTYLSTYTFPGSKLLEAIDPRNQASFQNSFTFAKHIELDITLRYVDVLPKMLDGTVIKAYATADARLAYTSKFITISILGYSLAQKEHYEFSSRKVPRSFAAKVSVHF